MDFIKKNKIILGVILVIIVVLGAAFVVFRPKAQQGNSNAGQETQNVKKVTPEEIGLTLALRDDKKAVEMKVTKLEGIKSLEYELDYTATVTEEGETNDVPRGVLSTIDVKPEDSEITKEILLGTCSSGTCKYDKVTSDIKVIMKVNYTNGEVGSVESKIPYKDN